MDGRRWMGFVVVVQRTMGAGYNIVYTTNPFFLFCCRLFVRSIVSTCKRFNLPIPTRPEPLFTYFPLVSPLKKTEQDGFNLGEDNKIRSIYIKDGTLRLEISAILRPGRFLEWPLWRAAAPMRARTSRRCLTTLRAAAVMLSAQHARPAPRATA